MKREFILGRVVGPPGTAPHIGENGHWWVGDYDTGVLAQGERGEAFSVQKGYPSYEVLKNAWGSHEPGHLAIIAASNPQYDKNGEVYLRLAEQTPSFAPNGENVAGWEFLIDLSVTGLKGDTGAKGISPHIGTNGNWWVGEQDTYVRAQGQPPVHEYLDWDNLSNNLNGRSFNIVEAGNGSGGNNEFTYVEFFAEQQLIQRQLNASDRIVNVTANYIRIFTGVNTWVDVPPQNEIVILQTRVDNHFGNIHFENYVRLPSVVELRQINGGFN